MTTLILTLQRHGVSWLTRLQSLLELTKPRIAVMVLAAVGVSAYVASVGHIPWYELFYAMLGTLLVAGSASAANQWMERMLDARMPRTQQRPLPSGRVSPLEVAVFAGLLLFVGELMLCFLVNAQTALLGLITWVLYVSVYTPLKTKTPANTAIGAIPGALPILMGWSATGQAINIQGGAIFLMLYLWQFPHFMAIAWIYRRHYEAAGMRMLTVVDPSGRRAGVQAVLGAVALLIVSLIPALVAPSLGAGFYLLVAFVLGSLQLVLAIRFLFDRNDATARRLLRLFP